MRPTNSLRNPKISPNQPQFQVEHVSGEPPLYVQVSRELERMVLALPLDHSDPLPSEPKLIDLWGVSRGTLRHAVNELARTGLLRVEQGRGTFVNHDVQVRLIVRERLVDVALPDSRFHLDFDRFVPDFLDRETCDATIMARPEWEAAQTVFAAPDNSLEHLRAQALVQGKRLVVPTFGLLRGYVVLDPTVIPEQNILLAATLDGMERCGTTVDSPSAESLGRIDLLVTGATAASSDGQHIGPGNRFLSIEIHEMEEAGVIDASTPRVIVVHDCQVVEGPVALQRPESTPFVVITPTRSIGQLPIAGVGAKVGEMMRGTNGNS